MKKILAFVGRSGSGKSSILSIMKKSFREWNVKFSVSKQYTTRPRRYEGENTYDFISKEMFDSFILDGEILEYRKYPVIDADGTNTDWFYGFGKKHLIEKDSDVIIMPDAQMSAVITLTANHPELHIVPVYIYCPSHVALMRAIKRESSLNGDNGNYLEICNRFIKSDVEQFQEYDNKVSDLLKLNESDILFGVPGLTNLSIKSIVINNGSETLDSIESAMHLNILKFIDDNLFNV